MAIEIVTTTTLALGSKELVHDGAIVSRLAAIEDMAAMSILCSDKTGTLTMNKAFQNPSVILYLHMNFFQFLELFSDGDPGRDTDLQGG